MTIDAHQHFWRYDPGEYAWIDERMSVLECDFLPGDLEPLIRRQGIDRTIAVQACQTTSETEWLLELAAATPFIAGVIGWVDLQADDVEARVERAARKYYVDQTNDQINALYAGWSKFPAAPAPCSWLPFVSMV